MVAHNVAPLLGCLSGGDALTENCRKQFVIGAVATSESQRSESLAQKPHYVMDGLNLWCVIVVAKYISNGGS
jgi:hypothetical protein